MVLVAQAVLHYFEQFAHLLHVFVQHLTLIQIMIKTVSKTFQCIDQGGVEFVQFLLVVSLEVAGFLSEELD